MNIEVIAGATCTIGGNVWDTAETPMLPKTSGTIYAVVQLNLPGHADHGKYWDADDDTWQASPVAWPTATYAKGSFWSVAVPLAMTTGKAGGFIVLADLTDDVATPADSTVMAGGFQQASVVSEDRLVVADIPTAGDISTEVWSDAPGDLSLLDVAISAIPAAPTVGDISTEVWGDAPGDLANLDVAVSTRLASGDYVTPPTVGDISTEVWGDAPGDLANLDVAVSTRLATAGYTTPPTVGAIADQVWDEALSGHATAGSTGAALDAVAIPAGMRTITITVEDEDESPVADHNVGIFDSGNTTLQDRKDTIANGTAVFHLDDGTYKVRLMKAGYESSSATLVVSADAGVTYTVTPLAHAAAPIAGKCMIFGTLTDAEGVAVSGAAVQARAVLPGTDAGVHQKGGRTVSTTTDGSGYFELYLSQGASVQIICREAGLNETRTVPEEDSQNVATWV